MLLDAGAAAPRAADALAALLRTVDAVLELLKHAAMAARALASGGRVRGPVARLELNDGILSCRGLRAALLKVVAENKTPGVDERELLLFNLEKTAAGFASRCNASLNKTRVGESADESEQWLAQAEYLWDCLRREKQALEFAPPIPSLKEINLSRLASSLARLQCGLLAAREDPELINKLAVEFSTFVSIGSQLWKPSSVGISNRGEVTGIDLGNTLESISHGTESVLARPIAAARRKSFAQDEFDTPQLISELNAVLSSRMAAQSSHISS